MRIARCRIASYPCSRDEISDLLYKLCQALDRWNGIHGTRQTSLSRATPRGCGAGVTRAVVGGSIPADMYFCSA